MTEYLSSLKNPKVRAFCALQDRKGRKTQHAFLAEGDKMVREALSSDFRVQALILREDRQHEAFPVEKAVPVYVLPERVFASLSDTITPQGVAAVVSLPDRTPNPEVSPGDRLLALDGVQDPGNVGTILRTADAAGLDGVLLGPSCADVFSPKVLRATMGSIFRMRLSFPEDLAASLSALRQAGYSILSSQLDGSPFYDRPQVGRRWVLIVGNEGNGVSPPVRAAATHHLCLPMRGGAESLNAAVAAGIMMYDLMK